MALNSLIDRTLDTVRGGLGQATKLGRNTLNQGVGLGKRLANSRSGPKDLDDVTLARKVDVVRRALALHHPEPADPMGVLAAFGGLEHAALAGFVLGGAAARVPVLLDGVNAGAAALVAAAFAPHAVGACLAGHRSVEPAHRLALAHLGLDPVIDLEMRLGEGTGALLALPVAQGAARALRDVATFDAAGVTDKEG